MILSSTKYFELMKTLLFFCLVAVTTGFMTPQAVVVSEF